MHQKVYAIFYKVKTMEDRSTFQIPAPPAPSRMMLIVQNLAQSVLLLGHKNSTQPSRRTMNGLLSLISRIVQIMHALEMQITMEVEITMEVSQDESKARQDW
jgi:hypothetical protein